MTALPDRLLLVADAIKAIPALAGMDATVREAAAALSGREGVAEVVHGDGGPGGVRLRVLPGIKLHEFAHGTRLYATPPPGDGVVVPREPTVDMIDGFIGACMDAFTDKFRKGYAAMLAAAPSAKGVAP